MFTDEACWIPNISLPSGCTFPHQQHRLHTVFSCLILYQEMGLGEGLWHPCVFVWLCRHVHAGAHAAHTHVHMRPEHIVRVPPSLSFLYLSFLRQGLPLNLDGVISDAQDVFPYFQLCPHVCTRLHCHAWCVHGYWMFKLMSSCLCCKHFTH